jgi:hypothetical protein
MKIVKQELNKRITKESWEENHVGEFLENNEMIYVFKEVKDIYCKP